MIVTLSEDITASEFPACSDEEKSSLKEAEAAVDEGLASIEADLEDALALVAGSSHLFLKITIYNQHLSDATGEAATPSPSSVTTPAPAPHLVPP